MMEVKAEEGFFDIINIMLPTKKKKTPATTDPEFQAPEPRTSSAKRRLEHMSIRSGDSVSPSPDLSFGETAK